jgi:hypothetical protein
LRYIEILSGPKWYLLTQVHDFADDLFGGGVGTVMGALGAVSQTGQALCFVAALPAVEPVATDPVVAARGRHVAGHFLGVTQDHQPVFGLSLQLVFVHAALLVGGTPPVRDLRQF